MRVEPPLWARAAAAAFSAATHARISRFAEPPAEARAAAVLVLLRDRGEGPETVVVTRSQQLRAHAGQVAFPGGAIEPHDEGPIAAALREAAEETSVDPASLHTLAVWPTLWIPVSGFAVTPVFAWCADPSDITGRSDDTEVVSAHALRFIDAAAPTRRRIAVYPNGATGPAFDIDGLFIWGFTGLVLDRVLHFAGWEQPWQPAEVVELPTTTKAPPESLGPAERLTGGGR
ncbi:MAG: NUDIX domain-containing protein [Actinomycetales bacterium]|nr:NUDIX domain-containing protein [Actinomycetales bacterium]